jgi:hypothetical protein
MHRSHLLALLALVLPCAAAAQEAAQPGQTRAGELRRQRAEKAAATRPYEPTALERAITIAEDKAVFLLGREGLYPKLGSLTTGSGFAFGAGYRNRPIFRYYGMLDVWAAGSLRKYWGLEARADFPDLAGGHAFLQAYASRRAYPREDYFGVGPASRRADHVSFALRTTSFGASGGVRPVKILSLGAGIDVIQPTVSRGREPNIPSIEDAFTDATAPGLARQPDYIRTSARLEVDYRQPRNARRGGWYRLEFSHYDDRDFDAYAFNRAVLDLRQYFGFLAERRVIAARAFVWTSDAGAGQTVPFYLMPTLGGNDSLRGFREYRFRGPHAILLQGEYRFEIWSGFEGALFYDAGKVADRRADLDLDDLERDYGIGFRFNTNEGVVMRVDAGFGSRDGKHLYITFGGVF